MRRTVRTVAFALLLLLAGAGVPALAEPALAAPPSTPAPAELGVGEYPRLARLQNGTIVASLTAHDGGGNVTRILESTDEGVSFRPIGEVRDPEAAAGQCCACDVWPFVPGSFHLA